MIKLNDAVVQSYLRAKDIPVKGQNEAFANSIAYTDNGSHFGVSFSDGSLYLYNAVEGTRMNIFRQDSLGIGAFKFTHDSYGRSIVAAPARLPGVVPEKNTIGRLYLRSTVEEKILRFFSGHTGEVHSVDIHPGTDLVLSCGSDGLTMLWDFRQPKAVGVASPYGAATAQQQGRVKLPRTCAVFDPKTVAFAVAVVGHQGRKVVKTYDVRKYSSGPFEEYHDAAFQSCPGGWDSIRYSPSGDELLLTPELQQSRVPPPHFLCDITFGRNFNVKKVLKEHLTPMLKADEQQFGDYFAPMRRSPQASFSPDGRYVVTGAIDRSIRVFATEGMAKETAQWGPDAHVYTLPSSPSSKVYPIGPIAWSPTTELVTSACSRLVMWLPQQQS